VQVIYTQVFGRCTRAAETTSKAGDSAAESALIYRARAHRRGYLMAKTGNRRSTDVVGVMRNARRKLRIDDAVSEAAKPDSCVLVVVRGTSAAAILICAAAAR